ncbi:prolipoprotein diacylglyceryl transferase [bacterium]|nr:prolipoprotein diacylglyceryl transferase [bacterium]
MLTSPGDIAFSIGNISVHYYGLCISLGIVLGIMLSYFVAKKYYESINPDIIFDVEIKFIIGGIICSSMYYCILNLEYYQAHNLEVLQIYKGGLSIHGALIGGLLGGTWYCEKHKLPILKLCDIFSFGTVLGQIIGRWGNFFNSEAFGFPCEHFLKLYIEPDKRPFVFSRYEYFHPTFLYESLLNIVVLVVLFIMLRKRPKDGTIFFYYLILYSMVRIIVEPLRIDSLVYVFGQPFPLVVSFVIIAIGMIGLKKIND